MQPLPEFTRPAVTSLDQHQREMLVGALKLGLSQKRACEVAGIHHGDFYSWMKIGRAEPTGANHDFFELVRSTQAKRVAALLAEHNRIALQIGKAACKTCGAKPNPAAAAKAIEWEMTHVGSGKGEFSDKQVIEVRDRGSESVFRVEWARLRGGILEQLRPFPDATRALLAWLATNDRSEPAKQMDDDAQDDDAIE